MPKQLTLDEVVTCLEENPFPGDALDPEETNYENILLRSEDGDIEIVARVKGNTEVEFFERFKDYKVTFKKVEEE